MLNSLSSLIDNVVNFCFNENQMLVVVNCLTLLQLVLGKGLLYYTLSNFKFYAFIII